MSQLYKNYVLKQVGILGLVLASLVGCGKDESKDVDSASLTHLIDEGQYDQVIKLLETGSHPPETQVFLAEAYLGKAEFIPLTFSNQVKGVQGPTPQDLEKLIPGCLPGALEKGANPPIKCVVKRILQQLPSVENSYFSDARNLLRKIYPNVATTPTQYNLLIAVVETASAFSRMGAVLKQYNEMDVAKASDQDIQKLFDQISVAAGEAVNGLNRARTSPVLVSKLFTGLERINLFNGTTGANLEFANDTGVKILTDLLTEKDFNLKSTGLKVLLIQRMDQLVQLFQS